MSTIVTRAGKGSPLTHVEVDANFTNLNTDKVEKTAAAITGGTINNTTIGATTPSTVNATTLSGQTARLNGTGQNLILQSNGFTTSWSNTAITLTGSQSDPFSGSTASLFVPSVANSAHAISNNTSAFSSGAQYTVSVYVKASGYTLFYISDIGAGSFACSYNLSAVTATPFTGCTGTITAVTGATGWYRITLTTTGTPTSSSRLTLTPYPVGTTLGAFSLSFAGDGTSGAVVYGTQVEFGSTANTYIPTTTTAVYGTPTLSFSGVSTLGLESNGALFLQPAGTGAIQAQATTSTTAGGNVRGAQAVDWQMVRSNAARVASGLQSAILGGTDNTASGSNAVVAGGAFHTASGLTAFVGGGSLNTASGNYTFAGSGVSNIASGYYGFVGGGFTNSTTANAAVTTQSGTMNGTTAVTLSGSNANIRVGQLITGTSISFGDTYVAAISGTALTLSKNASGSSTSTLSFFTPHGVVVGGGWNVSSGSHSFVGGGGWAGATGAGSSTNRATGSWSAVVGGSGNLASGDNSFIGGGGFDIGNGNTASGRATTVLGGYLNTASGFASTVVGGTANSTTGNYGVVGGANNLNNAANAVIIGGQYGTARGIAGYFVMPACASPIASVTGVSQAALVILGRQTTDATATALCSDANAASGTNQIILPNNSAYFFTGEVVSGVTGGGNTKGWTIEGVIKRGANAAATTLVGSTVVSTFGDAGAATWTIAVTADTTNGGIRVTFTGQAATTIRTVCQIRTTEMTF
jgi:hypothetical protein